MDKRLAGGTEEADKGNPLDTCSSFLTTEEQNGNSGTNEKNVWEEA